MAARLDLATAELTGEECVEHPSRLVLGSQSAWLGPRALQSRWQSAPDPSASGGDPRVPDRHPRQNARTDRPCEWEQEFADALDPGGSQVVVAVHQRGRLHDSRAWVELRYGIVSAVEEGLIRRMQLYSTPEQALETLGLRD